MLAGMFGGQILSVRESRTDQAAFVGARVIGRSECVGGLTMVVCGMLYASELPQNPPGSGAVEFK